MVKKINIPTPHIISTERTSFSKILYFLAMLRRNKGKGEKEGSTFTPSLLYTLFLFD